MVVLWLLIVVAACTGGGYYSYRRDKRAAEAAANRRRERRPAPAPAPAPVPAARRTVQDRQVTETGSMVYFANDRHAQADKEYRFNYKLVGGSWRAYILRMPDLRGRDARSIPTHRLWDEENRPYICWDTRVATLKDMQNISRVWADSIQEYIATGKRFGPE